ncbi:hypothetical protein HDU86_001386 [Geranomyces michiganensis]|nr:hypothetical protein HDU86_001386 [Geranomyces michiganensis]
MGCGASTAAGAKREGDGSSDVPAVVKTASPVNAQNETVAKTSPPSDTPAKEKPAALPMEVRNETAFAAPRTEAPAKAGSVTSPASQRKLQRLKPLAVASIQRDQPAGTEIVQSPAQPVLPSMPDAVYIERDHPGGEGVQSPLIAQPTNFQTNPVTTATANPASASAPALDESRSGKATIGGTHNRPGVSVFVTSAVSLDVSSFGFLRTSLERTLMSHAGLPPYTPSHPTTLGTALQELRCHRYRIVVLGGPRGPKIDLSDTLSIAAGSVSPNESGDCAVEIELNAALDSRDGQTMVFLRGKNVTDIAEEWGSISRLEDDQSAAWQPVVSHLLERGIAVQEYDSIEELITLLNGVLDGWITTEQHSNHTWELPEMYTMHRIAQQAQPCMSPPEVAEQLENGKGVTIILSGPGATSVAAQWGVKARQRVLPYFCGFCDEGCDISAILTRIIKLLGEQPPAAVAGFPAVRESFHAALTRSQPTPTAVMICGIEYLNRRVEEWMPDAKNSTTSLVLSASSTLREKLGSSVTQIILPPLVPALRATLLPTASALTASLVLLERLFNHPASDILFPSCALAGLQLNLRGANDGTANSLAAYLTILWATRSGRLAPLALQRLVGLPHRTHAALLRALEDARIVTVESSDGAVRFAHPAVKRLVETRYVATKKRATKILCTLASVTSMQGTPPHGFRDEEIGWMLARAGDTDGLEKWLKLQREKVDGDWMRLRATGTKEVNTPFPAICSPPPASENHNGKASANSGDDRLLTLGSKDHVASLAPKPVAVRREE